MGLKLQDSFSKRESLVTIKRKYSSEYDDVASVISDMCECLELNHVLSFVIIAFDEKPWPVDVATDLSVFLEQFSELLEWLNSSDKSPYTVNFYEQGIQRSLILNRRQEHIKITCESWSDWQPKYDHETVSARELGIMLDELRRVFLTQAKQLCPHQYNHPWLQSWLLQTTPV